MTKGHCRITLAGGGPSFDCAPGDTILRAALRAGLGMGYSCNVGACGNCRFELQEGAVRHMRADPPAWSERDLRRGRWLGCQSEPQSDCVVSFREDPAAVPRDPPLRRAARLVSVAPVARDMAEFAFAVDGPDAFRPGQYALLHVPGVEGGRPYSMANLPGEGVWRFVIRRTPGGGATGHLFDRMSPGDRLDIDGPYGLAWLRPESPRDILLIAGGSGLSPMLSIAAAAAADPSRPGRPVTFFYGARAEADLMPAGRFAALSAPGLRFVPVLSDDPGAGWAGARGFVHAAVEADLGPDLARREVYFAGPAAMSKAVQEMAHRLGLPHDHMHFDEFY